MSALFRLLLGKKKEKEASYIVKWAIDPVITAFISGATYHLWGAEKIPEANGNN